LLQLISPLTAPEPGLIFRELFSSGPYRDVRALVGRAISGWHAALRMDARAKQLVRLSDTCQHALRFWAASAVRACACVSMHA
jgi:hypothetical protein